MARARARHGCNPGVIEVSRFFPVSSGLPLFPSHRRGDPTRTHENAGRLALSRGRSIVNVSSESSPLGLSRA